MDHPLPKQPPSGEVPHASMDRLEEEVARYNIPLLDSNRDTHPSTQLLALLNAEHRPIAEWGMSVRDNLNRGWGGTDDSLLVATKAFDNSFITAYGLVRAGYDEANIEVPGVQRPPEWYMWIGAEKNMTFGEMFETFNDRQYRLLHEYPDLLVATHMWARDRIPLYGLPDIVGAVAIGAAEMYSAFQRIEEIQQLETQLAQTPNA